MVQSFEHLDENRLNFENNKRNFCDFDKTLLNFSFYALKLCTNLLELFNVIINYGSWKLMPLLYNNFPISGEGDGRVFPIPEAFDRYFSLC